MAEEDWLLAETRRIIREIEDAETHRAFWESVIQNIEVLVPLEGYDLLLDTHVAGTSYIPTLDRKMAHVDPGTLLTMVREPDNPVDPKAILIMTTEGQKIGYVPRAENSTMAVMMDVGHTLFARVMEIEEHGRWTKIAVQIYRDPKKDRFLPTA